MMTDIQEIAKLVGGGTRVIPTEGLPTEAEISAVEASLRLKFPADYRAFLKAFGSLLLEVKEEIWPRPGVGSVGPHWQQTRFELSVFGFCSEVDWLRIEKETQGFREENETDLAPVFAFANTSDRVCFAPDGSLQSWNRHEGAEPMNETFEAVFRRMVQEQREYKEELLGKRSKG